MLASQPLSFSMNAVMSYTLDSLRYDAYGGIVNVLSLFFSTMLEKKCNNEVFHLRRGCSWCLLVSLVKWLRQ